MTGERGATFENTYRARGYSPHYGRHIDDLAEWFADRLMPFKDIEISKEQRKVGVDGLPGEMQEITRAAHAEWLKAKKWGLTYNQMCVAFFAAWDKLQDSTP